MSKYYVIITYVIRRMHDNANIFFFHSRSEGIMLSLYLPNRRLIARAAAQRGDSICDFASKVLSN